ncbi:hypothetical protein [[Clostridium] aminophilum]|uniref:Uncharacterized protein n=1 Tax=[Clostridium] aminophilum TaxID=1526 RepID=A0A1I6JJ85_9FIRM|nr:hypothetical protein [[Clostridium] aminophilum]SFR79017.1 hypothetical protein SAMN02910262_01567 [[Clostridium] aminophilum]
MAAFADGSAGAVVSFARLTRQILRTGEALATAVKRSKIPTSSNPVRRTPETKRIPTSLNPASPTPETKRIPIPANPVSPTPETKKIPAPVRRRFCWLKMLLRGMMKKERQKPHIGRMGDPTGRGAGRDTHVSIRFLAK